MPLETASFITGLVATNPAGTDKKNQGDDHLRLIKSALLNSFPTVNRAFNLRRWSEKEADYLTKNTDYTQLTTDDGKLVYFDCSAAARVYGLLAVASAPVGMTVFVDRDLTVANNLTIAASSGELVNGSATLVLKAGESGILYKTATGWRFFITRVLSDFRTTISGLVSTAINAMYLKSTLAGVAGGPDVRLDRDNGAATNGDNLGRLLFDGRNNAAVAKTYAHIGAQISSQVAGSEAGLFYLQTLVAGAFVTQLTATAGIQLGAATGGPKGSGTLNATQLYRNGVLTDALATQMLHIQDQKAAGTAGGSFTSGAWRTRALNTVVLNEVSGASLASNQITLPAGTYYVEARAPAHATRQHQCKLRNVTDSVDILIGSSQYNDTIDQTTTSDLSGRFTIAATKVIELQHQAALTANTDGFGVAANLGVTEIYSEVKLFKVA